jgi:hypothetical protein
MLLGVAGVPAPRLMVQLGLTFSLIAGCIPYLVLAAALWRWLPRQRAWRASR